MVTSEGREGHNSCDREQFTSTHARWLCIERAVARMRFARVDCEKVAEFVACVKDARDCDEIERIEREYLEGGEDVS